MFTIVFTQNIIALIMNPFNIYITGPSLGKNESSNLSGSNFEICRFSVFDIFVLSKICSGNMLVRDRGKIIKVSWRGPGQNGRF